MTPTPTSTPPAARTAPRPPARPAPRTAPRGPRAAPSSARADAPTASGSRPGRPAPRGSAADRFGWITGGALPVRFTRWDTPATTYYLLQGAVGLLVVVGLVMVLSSSFVESYAATEDSFGIGLRQGVFAVIGTVGLLVVSRTPVAAFRSAGGLPLLLVVASWALQLLVFTPLGVEVGGNRNWILVAGMTLQPSEFIKVSIAVWCAAILTRQRRQRHLFGASVVPVLLGSVPGILLVVAGGDLGTALVLVLIVAAALFVAGTPLRFLAALAVPAVLGVAVMALTSGNRMGRILEFGSSTSDTQGVGWQTAHGLYALASGGWTGVGLGASREKWSWLPEAHNDFIFAIIGEELGLIGAMTVVLLFLLVGWACVRTVRATDDFFVKVLVGSVMAWVLGQAAFNIAVVLGLAPVIGVPLPLISQGGSALVATMVGLGLVLAGVRSLPGAGRALRGRPGLVRRSLAVVPGVRRAARRRG